jgi:hypothetical protein
MGHFTGRVIEIRLGAGKHLEVCISCPEGAVPSAGQYVLASELSDPNAILSTPIFLREKSKNGFWAAPLFLTNWVPGANLHLVGPLGHGFDLPHSIQRLGLAVLGETVSRLMPLVSLAAKNHIAMTLFTDLNLPILPAAVEVSPLGALKEALDWPDFLALDTPLDQLSEVREVLGVPHGTGLPCPSQVLITTPMPCAGLAQCGACAVPARRGWKLACEDGPVFDLSMLKW